ncbi:HAMP domain-containing sensor histidine kinase [uncultured Duncaniella sp.]|uniref:sensor histidine kinase n=1 Tax=uncultured Duncaniella sp. TaxID=2768039 RepID=UPI0025B18515|nr:HAMP domain-containing sensor histidine kinase [uncultured Duncaniella sp.]
MPQRFLSIIITIIALSGSGIKTHATSGTMFVIDSLRTELHGAKTPTDSLPIMLNLYDVLPREKSNKIGDSLYYTAMRAHDYNSALDIIRNQANRYMRRDSMLRDLTEKALKCPESNDRKETVTFIRFMQNMRRAYYSDTEERKEALKERMEEIMLNPPSDLYDRAALTHGICLLLSDIPNSNLLVSYMDSLKNIINRLPSNAYSLKNAYNVHAASIYSFTNPERSMEADLNTLRNIELLKKQYSAKGRKFRNYHPSFYTIYTRLLSNFEILDTAKVNEYYSKAIVQLPFDPAIHETYSNSQLPDIYYSMFYKDYSRALPLIKEAINQPMTQARYKLLLQLEIECAEALGDKEILLKASSDYIKVLKDEIEEQSHSSYRELQTAYAIYDMKYRVTQMAKEKSESVASLQHTIILVSICAVIILIILAIFLFLQFRKNRMLIRNLSETNQKLLSESENLKQSRAELIRARDTAQKANNLKTDFIKNMSYEVRVPLQAINEYSHLIADCVGNASSDDMERISQRHLTHFADLLELNSELLSTIINDVLRLSEIDSSPISVQPVVINIKLLCEATLDSVRHRVKPGVTLSLAPECGPIEIFSDPTRLQQILNNLLTNAAKFTDKGSIVLAYRINDSDSKIIFTVTDTGIGINAKNKDKIFDRFFKIDRDSQGAGLGLTIARLIAQRLEGNVELDTSYTSGARFSVTLPKN